MELSVFNPCFIRGLILFSIIQSRVIESVVLAVRRLARLSAAKVSGRPNLAVALLAQQLDEPGFMLDFLIENPSGHVVGARILAKGQTADLTPGPNSAAFGLQEHGQDVRRGRIVGKIGVGAAGPIREFANVLGNAAAQLVDSRGDQLEMSAILKSGI